MEGEDDQDVYDQTFIEKPAILDMYKAAAVVSEAALQKAITLCVEGADVGTICGDVDTFIQAELLKVFSNKKSKKLERGIGFPTCLSINDVMGHFSPTPDDSVKLKLEDIVKIELGAHIDGYSAQCAHTICIGGKAKGKQADVVLAAYNAFIAATRSIEVGGCQQVLTQNIAKVCEAYEVEPVQGVLSHKTKKHLIDGNEVIINKETPE
jgi:methionine aminopeptidase